ncbi:unnamed protein product, partial [Mesorhabditis spiculigera]
MFLGEKEQEMGDTERDNATFTQVFTRLAGSAEATVDRDGLFDALCCAGKTPTQWDELCPRRDSAVFNLEDALLFYQHCPQPDPPLIEVAHIPIPTAIVTQKVHTAFGISDQRQEELLDLLYAYDRDGLFDLAKVYDFIKFCDDMAATKDDVLKKLLSKKVESPAGNKSTPPSTQLVSSVVRRGFVIISRDIRFTAFRFLLAQPQKLVVTLGIIRNNDMDDKIFLDDIFCVVSDANTETPVAISLHKDQQKNYTTGELELPAGEYSIVVMCGGVTLERVKPSGEGGEQLIGENKKLTKRFKMTLMNMFEMFDWDMDGLLNRKEFDAFTAASGDDPMSDEDWQVLSEHFSIRDGCVPMSTFLQMHQIEADSCEDGTGDFADMWTSLHLVGYDDHFQLRKACPIRLEITSQTPVTLDEDFRICSKWEERGYVTEYFYRHGVDQNAPLPTKLFMGEYFGVLVTNTEGAQASDVYALKIKGTDGVEMRLAVDPQCFKPTEYHGQFVSLAFFSSSAPNWDVELAMIKMP